MQKYTSNYLLLIFVFLYINVFGGILVTYGFLTQSTFFLLLLPIFLFISNGLKIRRNIFLYLIFILLYLVFNKIYNDSNINSVFNYLAFALFPFLIYYLILNNRGNILSKSFKKVLIFTLLIQIPLLVIQIIFYDYLHELTVTDIIKEDFTTGTFWMKNDPALNFFILMLLNTVLYNKRKIFGKSESLILILICFLGISFSNSKVGFLCLFLSLIFYMISITNIKKHKYEYLVLLTIFGIVYLILNELIMEKIEVLISRLTNVSDGAIENFNKGEYARAAAIIYFLETPLKIIGDGAGRYLNMNTMEYKLGLHGQSLLMYAEIGIAGIILYYSFMLNLLKRLIRKVNKFHIISFVIIMLFTLTSRPFTDISILLSYFIFQILNNER